MGIKANFMEATRELWSLPLGKFLNTEQAPEYNASLPAGEPEHTLIAEGTFLDGALKAVGAADIFGGIKGDVSCEGDVLLCGKLEGDAVCRSLRLLGSSMEGNVIAADSVEIDADSVLNGDIKAARLLLNGKVKGNLQIQGTLTLGPHAAIQGDLTAGALSVSECASLCGRVQVCPQPGKAQPPVMAPEN